MTTYSPNDLTSDWEFKIVRATTGAFRQPSTLNRLLQEEAQAGWTMVEKFDDQRIRFKRPRQARLNDSELPHGVDPYRTHYGMPPVGFLVLIVAAVLLIVTVIQVLPSVMKYITNIF